VQFAVAEVVEIEVRRPKSFVLVATG
jgi:hypothetical protein